MDIACLIIGSAVGASASAAFIFHRFLRGHLGDPSEPRAHGEQR